MNSSRQAGNLANGDANSENDTCNQSPHLNQDRRCAKETVEAKLFENRSPVDVLTKREVATALRLSVGMIDKLVANGNLPYFKIGRSIRFGVSDVRAFLLRRKRP